MPDKASKAVEGLDTFPRLLMHHARVRGNQPAMREKDLGIWQTWTWEDAREQVVALCRRHPVYR